MAEPGWWKLSFSRKKSSGSKVLYEIPAEYSNNTGHKELSSTPLHTNNSDSQLNARLEKIADKNATKGRHVKVSHSGRFKEKKKIRVTLAENPIIFPDYNRTDENQMVEK